MHQKKYTIDILTDTGLLGAKPSKVPIEQNHTLQDSSSHLLPNSAISTYRRIVGRLLYLTVARPDIAYSVQVLSQFLATPRSDHLQAAHKVLRYLKGSPGQGLLMAANSPMSLTAYCDSDWAGDKETRHSLTGYCVQFGTSFIFWKCKKQHTISRSSAEAKYRSMADMCCELTWLLNLFKSFGIYNLTPISLYCDNKSAMYIASNSMFHERAKYIDIDCHIVREKLQLGTIAPTHISTALQPADIFTKALSAAQIQGFISKLGVCNLFKPPNLRGMLQLLLELRWRMLSWMNNVQS